MILNITFIFIIFLVFLVVILDKYSPAIQFFFITGLGFMCLYDTNETEDGTLHIYQFLFGIVLITISYVKEYD